jgi:hypothetical protein
MSGQEQNEVSRAQKFLTGARALWPLTWPGLLLILVAGSGLKFWWRGQHDFVVQGAVLVGFLVLLVGLFFVIIGAIYLHRGLRTLDKALHCQLETGEVHRTGFRVSRLKWWPFLQVKVDWERPINAEVILKKDAGWWSESVRLNQRGRYQSITRRITVRDIFGLFAIQLIKTSPASVYVMPATSKAGTRPELRLMEGDGSSHPEGQPVGDYVEMRRYAPGDPLRLVIWKAYARARRLLVRMPERAITPQPSTAAFFVAGLGDDDSASVARTMLESGLFGDEVIFGADGSTRLSHTAEDAVEAIVDSAHHRLRGGQDLGHFIRQVDAGQLGRCVLFLPSKRGPWLEHVVAHLSELPTPPLLVVTIDGHLDVRRRHWTSRLFDSEYEGVDLNALLAYQAELEASGAHVQVVHRTEGRTLGPADMTALRAAS